MKRFFLTILCGLVAASASASDPIAAIFSWDVQVGQDKGRDIVHENGETTTLRPRFMLGVSPVNLHEVWTVDLLLQEQGTTNLLTVGDGRVLSETNGQAEIRIASTNYIPPAVYDYTLMVGSATTTMARCKGLLEVKNSLAFDADNAVVPAAAIRTFDWATVLHANIGLAPFLSQYQVEDVEDDVAALYDGRALAWVTSITSGVYYGSAAQMSSFPSYLARTNDVPPNSITNLVNGGQSAEYGLLQLSPNVWRITFPLSSDGESLSTNRLSWVVSGVTVGFVDTNGISMVKGSLQLFEEDLRCNVRALDGSKQAPSVTFQGAPITGWYRRSIYGGSGWGFADASNDVLVVTRLGLEGFSTNYCKFNVFDSTTGYRVNGTMGATTNFTVVSQVLTNGAGAVTGVVTRTVTIAGGVVLP